MQPIVGSLRFCTDTQLSMDYCATLCGLCHYLAKLPTESPVRGMPH